MLAVANELREDATRDEEVLANKIVGLLQPRILVCVYVKLLHVDTKVIAIVARTYVYVFEV